VGGDEEAPFLDRAGSEVKWWSWRRLDRHPYIIPQKQRNLDGGRDKDWLLKMAGIAQTV